MSKAAELAALIGSQSAQSNRNLVTNGAMQIWQRGTTIDTISNGSHLCDRWRIAHSGTDGNVDVDRSTDVPTGKGFGFSQKISMDASESSLDAADVVRMHQRFEGQNLQSLKKGTSSAEPITISFYVKSSVASSNYSLVLRDEDNDRNNALSYTVSSANTWEFQSLTFPGDTTGALDNDTARSFDIDFILDGGTNRTSGTYFNGTWAAGDTSKTLNATTGWLVSTSPTWFITGVQMQIGEQATPFEHRTFADDLIACERYYQIAAPLAGSGNSTNFKTSVSFKTAMRAQPTLSFTDNDFDVTDGHASNYASTDANPSWDKYISHSGGVVTTANHSSISGDARRGTMLLNAVDDLQMDAEL